MQWLWFMPSQLQMAKTARENASRNIPVKLLVISIKREVLEEEWG
jgi:hypothetical protein